MEAPSSPGDYFDRARAIAVALLVAAGAVAILGAFLDWVTITERPELDPQADFGEQAVEAPEVSKPYSGVEARDGWVVVVAGCVLLLAAAGLALRRRGVFAGVAFLAAMVIGGVAFADYRGVGDVSSAISDRMEIFGDPDPAIGITLVAIGAIAGLLGSVAGFISTPRRAP
jgi:hypothetical protein